jgi:Core-2/I-Branching enzyme
LSGEEHKPITSPLLQRLPSPLLALLLIVFGPERIGQPQAPEPSAATPPEVNAGAAGGDNMRIAYIILAYRNVSGHRIGTLPNQLARLVSRLDAPSVSFFIHIDANTDDATYAEMVDGMIGRHNVCFLPRHQVTWGGWGTVAATLEGLEQVIRAKVLPDYVILLTGADYPLRTPGDIEAFLAEHRGTSFIDVRQLPDYTWNWHGTMDRFHGQSLPSGMKPFGGEGRWALSGDCAAYVKGVADGGLSRVFEGVGIPDEHFVHTVVANSPFRDRLSSLARVAAPAVKGVHYVDWERGSPKVLGVEDFERLIASRALFARKFDIAEDSAILDMIDAHS